MSLAAVTLRALITLTCNKTLTTPQNPRSMPIVLCPAHSGAAHQVCVRVQCAGF
jgi:hypothetical protein